MSAPRWQLRRDYLPGQAPWKSLQMAFGLSAQAAKLAWSRGEDTEESLAWRLRPEWNRTFDPYLLTGMDRAVARIRQAIRDGERIVIYGDYDVDGVTATALLVRVLEKLGVQAEYFIPNRFNDGYGLHGDCIRELGEKGPGLFISVDCGVRSVEEVKLSGELGIQWIITDHHALGAELPEAEAVLHPALGDAPNAALAGVGVAFKLAQALLDAVPNPKPSDQPFLDGLLKLVALGTIADVASLTGENALLVKRGLQAMGGGNGPGLSELLKAARIEGIPRALEIGFGVAPRLNAVGRMGGAEAAVRLLLTRDPQEAKALAAEVERLNAERKAVQEALLRELPPPDGAAFDLALQENAHKGVLGIVAAHRMRETDRPTGVGTVVDGVAHCSLRAPDGYDLTELLTLAQPFLRSGGGHRFAAGMTFDAARTPFVRQALIQGAKGQAAHRQTVPLWIDGTVEDLPSPEELLALEPFGKDFAPVALRLEGRLESAPVIFGQGHGKLRLSGCPGEIVWFNGADTLQSLPLGAMVNLLASPIDHPRWGRSWRLEALLEPRS
ncbi:MAG: DHH family phosphoesterase [Firmicutes bacterium]|nr:DHH family phosphoesterase [Bacillota bacterium]